MELVEHMRLISGPEGLQFDIHADGSITRTGKEDSETVSYVYPDKNGNSHKLGTWEIKVNNTRYQNGFEKKPISGEHATRYSDVYEAEVYYKKVPGKMQLVNIKKKALDYRKEDLIISYHHLSSREYVDIGAFASFIGALAEVSYDDIGLNGFTCW